MDQIDIKKQALKSYPACRGCGSKGPLTVYPLVSSPKTRSDLFTICGLCYFATMAANELGYIELKPNSKDHNRSVIRNFLRDLPSWV